MFNAWVARQENNLQVLVRAQAALEQEVSSGAAQLSDVYPGDRDGGSYANELQIIREMIGQQINELQVAVQGGVSNFKDFLVNTMEFAPEEVEQLVQENPVPTVTAGGAVAKLMAEAAAQKSAEAAGAAALESTATAAAGETALAAGAVETGGGILAGLSIAGVLTGTIIVVALVGGGILIYSQVHGGSNSTPAQSSPGASAAAPPATFDIDGNYNGTFDGAACQAPDCHFTIKKESDPSGPDTSQAGSITFTYTAVNYKPALNGVASTINETIGPMNASLAQNGTVSGSGTTTDADTTPGGGNTATSNYTLTGFFLNGTKGQPSFSITMNVGGISYHLTGTR